MKLQTFTDIADFHRVQDHCQWCGGVGVCMCVCASVLRMSVVYVLRVCVGCTFCFAVLCVLCCAVMCGVWCLWCLCMWRDLTRRKLALCRFQTSPCVGSNTRAYVHVLPVHTKTFWPYTRNCFIIFSSRILPSRNHWRRTLHSFPTR